MREKILSVGFDCLTMEEAIEISAIALEKKTFFHCVTANPEIVMIAEDNETYREIISRADLVLADGIGIVLASKIKKGSITKRIAGIDFLEELFKLANENNWSVFFWGAEQQVLDFAVQNIKKRFENLRIVGAKNGYTSTEEEILSTIAQTKPDIFVVALGAPRQELWISDHRKSLEQCFCIGVGGSLDVWGEKVKRAPAWIRRMHFEWLYRAFKDPKRWRRLLVIPRFLWKNIT